MKTYRGIIKDGRPVVTVDHELLPIRPEMIGQGIAWGGHAAGVTTLAFAILADFLDDQDRAQQLAQGFANAVLARFPELQPWTLDGRRIEAAIEEMELGL